MLRVTRVGLLQLVPAEEGSFLLLAEVGALLQEPVGDPTLTDPWTDGETERERSAQPERTCDFTHSSCGSPRAAFLNWWVGEVFLLGI